MTPFVRYVLLAIIVLLAVAVVVGIASAGTGALEKAVLVGGGALLVLAASRVRRIGRPGPLAGATPSA
jgi:hypothetical protein